MTDPDPPSAPQHRAHVVRITPLDENGLPTGPPTILRGRLTVEVWSGADRPAQYFRHGPAVPAGPARHRAHPDPGDPVNTLEDSRPNRDDFTDSDRYLAALTRWHQRRRAAVRAEGAAPAERTGPDERFRIRDGAEGEPAVALTGPGWITREAVEAMLEAVGLDPRPGEELVTLDVTGPYLTASYARVVQLRIEPTED